MALRAFGLSVHAKPHMVPGMTARPPHPDQENRNGFLRGLLRAWREIGCWLISQTFIVLFRLKATDYRKVPEDRACIFVCNHGSHFDGFFIYAAINRSDRRPVVPVVWYRLLEYTVVGPLLEHLRAIPINNEAAATASRILGLRSMIRHLREGRHIWIQPEGHRCDVLDRFQPGAALISLKTGAPMVPVSLRGVQPLFKDLGRFPRLWGRVELLFHSPVYPHEAGDGTDENKAVFLMEKVRSRIAATLDYPIGTP